MSRIPVPTVVRIEPSQATRPVTYDEGYAVIPLTRSDLRRSVAATGLATLQTQLRHEPEVLYFFAPDPGSAVTIENVGNRVSIFQKLLPMPHDLPDTPQPEILPRAEVVVTAAGGRVTFDVEVATTKEQIFVGLANRPRLGAMQGLFSIWAQPLVTAVWTRKMRFPIDVAFVDASDVIVNVEEELPQGHMDAVISKGPVTGILEVQAGVFRKYGIRAGATVTRPK